ncbi:hypothetical protein [Sorangium sp. So ce513]|uniref:hypothetical protein n=1 Tax=Sorangium sp. So ce513 TaxID=3133315 RepID=UPI003F60A2F8
MTLVAGTDIHVIACPRGTLGETRTRVFGVRWAGRPDLGFPSKGFVLHRVIGTTRTQVGRYFLPKSTDWPSFKADADARRPVMGPYFADLLEENLGYLLPIVRMADPDTPAAERPGLVERAVEFFGNLHAGEPALTWTFWPDGEVPPLASLLADPASQAALVDFYRGRCAAYLMALALRFEYSVLFGLAIDDVVPPGSSTVHYEITGEWAESGSSTTALDVPKPPCTPAPPVGVIAMRIPGDVAHPAFLAWSDWGPPAALAPTDAAGTPLPPSALVPRAPAAFTALTWSAPVAPLRLIGYGPVLYTVSRFHFGADSAELPNLPALPPGATFIPISEGELLLRPSTEPHLVDRPGMDWPPLEGYYTYEVRGVNLLGFTSATGTHASVRHHDDLAPVPPRARLRGAPLLTASSAGQVTAELDVHWHEGEDFVSPDVVDFRVTATFTPLDAIPVTVTEIVDQDPLTCRIRVASLAGPADTHAGRRLMLPNGEFVIISHGAGAPALMTVRRSAARAPAVGATGIVFAPGAPTPLTRVARMDRTPAVAARVDVLVSSSPVELRLAPVPAASVTSGRIYLHLLRTSFAFARVGDSFVLTPPAAEAPAADAWAQWLALPDPAAAITGSPALLYPPHQLVVSVAAPPGFLAGTLTLRITAADGTKYVASPALPTADPALTGLVGNESAAAEVVASVRSAAEPAAPDVGPFDPAVRRWATTAASYAEAARYDVTWAPVTGAIRYEIWRALEGAIAGATAATGDADLRALAATHPAAFELRTGDAFATHHVDELPGRAPTRALYRIRAVSAAGVAGAFSGIIGPVYVPDVRPPPPPNLLRVVATRPEELDRGLAVEWAQAALDPDIRFDVQVREAGGAFVAAGILPRGTAPIAGRFRFVHGGRVPGRRYEYRVVAVREALDPVDPSATLRRDVRSLPSVTRAGVAVSAAPLAPPAGLSATVDGATGAIQLAWTNADSYDAILIYRRAPGRFGFERIAALGGGAVAHVDPAPEAGTWAYEVRARGVSREARSTIVEVTVP